MPDDELDDILDGTVDEVKEAIKDSSEVDFKKLLEKEKENKDRKTVKEFINRRIDDEENEEEETKEETSEDLEELHEMTEGGLLGSFNRNSILVGGLLVGILVGLLVGFMAGGMNQKMPESQVKANVKKLVTSGGFNGSVNVSNPKVRNQMYRLNVTFNQRLQNRTVTQSQGVYVTLDGTLLFPIRKRFGQQVSPINIPRSLNQLDNSGTNGPNSSTNTTS